VVFAIATDFNATVVAIVGGVTVPLSLLVLSLGIPAYRASVERAEERLG
jgi:hypothetical protein